MYFPLPTPQEMAQWDAKAIQDFGLQGALLMENASRELLAVLKEYFPGLGNKQVIIFAGSGNNGGDGFALARHLYDLGAVCHVLHSRPLELYKNETAYHLRLAKQNPIHFQLLKDYDLSLLPQADIIVDALLGTGFQGPLRTDYLQWVKWINARKKQAFILSIDIPSGLSGLTGRPGPEAVQATATVTFEEAKLGLMFPEARDYTGKLYIRQIGIPRQVKTENHPAHYWLSPKIYHFLPKSRPMAHKGTFGHLLIIGGSPGLIGAPVLAARGGLRSGCGLVTIAAPSPTCDQVKKFYPEVMTLELGENHDWSLSLATLENNLSRFDAVVLGPGIGRTGQQQAFLKGYLELDHPPTVFDADALFWLAQDKNLWTKLGKNCILTPHPGEMARLCSLPTQNVQAERSETSQWLARESQSVVVLKGAGTMITAPKEPVFLVPVACPNLAIGGSGDILSGIIGSLLAQRIQPLAAGCLGALWHALAGLHLAKKNPFRGNLAHELADVLPGVLAEDKSDQLFLEATSTNHWEL